MKGHGVLFSPFTQTRSAYFFKPQLKNQSAWGTSIGGIEIERDDYQLNSLFGVTRDTLEKYNVYARTDLAVANRYTVTLGARAAVQHNRLNIFSSNDQINRAFATIVGMAYTFSPEVSSYLRRAESFRFPKADELASMPQGTNNLRTQRGLAYESGIIIHHEPYSVHFGIYQLNLKDEIAFDPTQTVQNPFGSNRNLDPTMRRGITLSLKNQLTEKIVMDGQYNYVQARFQNGINARERIPLVSEHILRAGINYHLSSHWNLYPEFIFTGNQFSANDDANKAGASGGYTIYNINLRYEYQHLTAALRFNNIFNKYYYFYTVFMPSMQTEFFYPAPGRNITLTVNYAFA
jgi:iron complex outermembrane receptor protein